ncbi:MAG: hypothetical protein J6Y24_09140 [Bacteroidales bacterium]|nr:hypothetical protein [Bacteroidales bacterium]
MRTSLLRKPSAIAAPYWGMLKKLSNPIKLELVVLLSESMEKLEDEPDSSKENDKALLDSALAKFSGDWGGEKDAMEIARELRQGSDIVRNVDTW